MTYTFFAHGMPRPKGNHAAVCPRARAHHHGHATPCRPFVTEDYRGDKGKRLKEWETSVRVASRSVAPHVPLEGPVKVTIELHFSKPKARAKDGRPQKTPGGDVDKLCRAVLDGLQAKCKGYMMRDDNQVTWLSAALSWADERGPGAQITIEPLGEEQELLFADRR